jgi:hypothetical protein
VPDAAVADAAVTGDFASIPWSTIDADFPFDTDAACAVVTAQAQAEYRPVDIMWVVDNSGSMKAPVDEVKKGLNAFAALVSGKSLDYKIIMLSLRDKASPITYNGGTRYPVCIPPPLAGDDNCGNGPRFFQSSIDIKSTQPLEQFLGTLGQTKGYLPGDERGGEPWRMQLRPDATRTIVIVSDDNSRLTAADFETFAGGKNPNNPLFDLPPGILDPSWNGLFTGYTFDGLYGWGSDTNPATICTYPDRTMPPSSGTVYTALVQKTGGVRAKICDGASTWGPFFDAVAQAVGNTARLSCEFDIPTPDGGMLDPTLVNVSVASPTGATGLVKVSGPTGCTSGGWYYDDETAPTKVLLCPSSCDAAQSAVSAGGSVHIHFGCKTIVG